MLRFNTPAWVTLLLVLLVIPASAFAEEDSTCLYPGFRGGPFPGTPTCTEGFKTEPLTCTNCTRSWDRSEDERVVCADESDCVELVGKYMTCGGPISPFLVDDQDNVYFWSGRWNLHALDKRGNLRWRFDLCNPPEDFLCGPGLPDCQPHATPMVSMVTDYHGTLYFFIGNVLYGIESDGRLVLKHRVTLPGFEMPEGGRLLIANGPQNFGSDWRDLVGSPVMHTDGTMSVAYKVFGQGAIEDGRMPGGVFRLSRAGEVLSQTTFLWQDEPKHTVGLSRLLGAPNGQVAFAGVRSDYPRTETPGAIGMFYALQDERLGWQAEIPNDYSMPGSWTVDRIRPQLAAGPLGRIYGVTANGAVYAFDLATEERKRLFHFYTLGSFSWQNRPVVDADGMLYLAETRGLQGGFLWALDTQKLWQNPENAGALGDPPFPEDHPGIKWARVYGGAGGWTTPVLSKNGRVYVGMGGIAAHDVQTGEQIWWFGKRTMASAPTILSDGTVVVGQGITGRIFFLKEDTNNGGMAEQAWPTARHDRYLSNNARHPFRWDRSGEAPYPPVTQLLEEVPSCWNEVDWDVEECGPIQEPDWRTETDADDAGPDVADTGTDADARQEPPVDAGDVPEPRDVDAADSEDKTPVAKGEVSGCSGCGQVGALRGVGREVVLMAVSIGGAVLWRRRRREG